MMISPIFSPTVHTISFRSSSMRWMIHSTQSLYGNRSIATGFIGLAFQLNKISNVKLVKHPFPSQWCHTLIIMRENFIDTARSLLLRFRVSYLFKQSGLIRFFPYTKFTILAHIVARFCLILVLWIELRVL